MISLADNNHTCGSSLDRGARDAAHVRKVEQVVRQLKSYRGTRPLIFQKKGPAHQVPKRYGRDYQETVIDVRPLDAILDVDPVARTCQAEPGVTFRDLCRATLRVGLVPLVVPELKTITLGGAVAGCSLESMSYKFGGFHDTCLEYEVVTAAGDVIRCAPEGEHRLLFQMMHGSFGTLGFVSRLTFKLVPAKPYVRVRYERYSSLSSFQAAIRERAADAAVDFIDGIIHSPSALVLCVGQFAPSAPYTTRYDWTKVYYKSTLTRTEDYLETLHYLFRYDRGVTNVNPKSFLGRLFFGRVLSSDLLLRLAKTFRAALPARPDVTLDVFIPFSNVPSFLDWYERRIGFFPLWCVPYRRVHDYEWLAPAFYRDLKDDLFLDLAIYGLQQPEGRNYYKEIEDELLCVHGLKTLISHNYYDEAAFWSIWNRDNYLTVKGLTDPRGVLGDLFLKTRTPERGPPVVRARAVLPLQGLR